MFPRSTIQFIFILFVSTSLLCCKDKEIEPLNVLSNGDVETGGIYPEPWYPYTNNTGHNFVWSKDESSSGERSLKLNANSNSEKIAYWYQFVSENLPFEKDITLKVNIKADLVGTGASIVIRADGENAQSGFLQFATTEGPSPITGTFDWKEYSVTLESLDPETKIIRIYLVYLSETTGEVYFDDISLTY